MIIIYLEIIAARYVYVYISIFNSPKPKQCDIYVIMACLPCWCHIIKMKLFFSFCFRGESLLAPNLLLSSIYPFVPSPLLDFSFLYIFMVKMGFVILGKQKLIASLHIIFYLILILVAFFFFFFLEFQNEDRKFELKK